MRTVKDNLVSPVSSEDRLSFSKPPAPRAGKWNVLELKLRGAQSQLTRPFRSYYLNGPDGTLLASAVVPSPLLYCFERFPLLQISIVTQKIRSRGEPYKGGSCSAHPSSWILRYGGPGSDCRNMFVSSDGVYNVGKLTKYGTKPCQR